MKLFFDTETTGLINRHAPATHESQPYLVQLAALLTDNNGVEKACYHTIIKPEGWIIPDEAVAVHGITTEIASAVGIPLMCALAAFNGLLYRAEYLIAHNISYDLDIMLVALWRAAGNPDALNRPRRICTKEESTNVVRIPGRYGRFKWPTLPEAYRHFYGCDFEGAHDALVDVRACAAVHFALMGQPMPLVVSAAAPLSPALLVPNVDHLLEGSSWQQVHQCLDKEVRFRQRDFPKRINAGGMDQRTADQEIKWMTIAKHLVGTRIIDELPLS